MLFVVLILSVLLIVSCTPEIPKEQLEEELDQLSDEDIDTLIEETSNDDARAVAGQAFLSRKGYTWTNRVSRNDILIAAQKVKIERLEKQLAQSIDVLGETEGATPIEYGQPSPVGSTPPDDGIEQGIESPGEEEGIIVIGGG